MRLMLKATFIQFLGLYPEEQAVDTTLTILSPCKVEPKMLPTVFTNPGDGASLA